MTPTMAGPNRLLALLPPGEYERLRPHLELVGLSKRTILHNVGDRMQDAYFLLNGIVSLLAGTARGETVGVAVVGSEGIIGLPIVLDTDTAPCEAMVLVPGSAWRIRADILRTEFRRGAVLHALLLQYTCSLLAQCAQSAVCHRFHTSSQRLSRWLLTARDRVDSDSLELTQDALAYVLGIQRTYVNAAALELQNADLIRYRHGKITILDCERLERAACECYSIVRDKTSQFPAAL